MTNIDYDYARAELLRLREPFPKHKIEKLDTGRGFVLDYVSHAHVTERLLEIDPFWTWEPVAFDERGLPALDANGGLWIKLTVLGVTRYGYGEPQGRDEYDKIKGAIGNAIRVAAMRFGVALHLWQKETGSSSSTGEPVGRPPEQIRQEADWAGKKPPKLQKATEKQLDAVQKMLAEVPYHHRSRFLNECLGKDSLEALNMADVDWFFETKKAGVMERYRALSSIWAEQPEDDPWAVDGL